MKPSQWGMAYRWMRLALQTCFQGIVSSLQNHLVPPSQLRRAGRSQTHQVMLSHLGRTDIPKLCIEQVGCHQGNCHLQHCSLQNQTCIRLQTQIGMYGKRAANEKYILFYIHHLNVTHFQAD